MTSVDRERRLPLEIAKVAKGMTLSVTPLSVYDPGHPESEGRFLVRGDTDEYWVNLRTESHELAWTCDCGNFTFGELERGTGRRKRDYACKHIAAVLLATNDPQAVDLMFEWIRRQREGRVAKGEASPLPMESPSSLSAGT